ncbi:MAG: hypothetical protein SFW62_01150 [Alphaproteobacteria bacterium]|nr:hypothetical protein [Alphaproteobacteria bacterium]
MPIMDKLLALAAAGRTLTDVTMSRRLLLCAAKAGLLALLTAIVFGVFLAGLLGALYVALTQGGMDSWAALSILGVLVLAMAAILAALTIMQFKRLKYIIRRPAPPFIGDIGRSFLDGFLTPPSKWK